ncbi:MAG: MerR family transcriptional regulator [Elusimicrobiota bacterium]|nr:MerR family transcriptional regulator [Endomicrobiia bacterium]MCX7910893.1 MerR family transcriptional regulator [Endomicrobiia bacterium]MDW8166323.1 MerR family transcriptional regulator [Elusimicrobiota bacterium]
MIQDKKYYTIKEFSQKTGVEEYVLRYWEKVFTQLKPLKTEKGHRRYTDDHIVVVEKIKELMWEKKYTIEGAKKALKEFFSKNKKTNIYTLNLDLDKLDTKQILKDIKNSLEEIIKILNE